MKTCTRCGESKDVKCFSKNTGSKSNKDGLSPWCKPCHKEYKSEVKKTPNGITESIYGGQRYNSKRRNHPMPNYTLSEFREWCYNQPNWDVLYEGYVKSNYDTMMKPSGDRLDNSLPYSFDNLQLLTRREHFDKTASDIINGIELRKCKAVRGTHKISGKVVEFFSQSEAGRNGFKQSDISACLRGVQKSHYGYVWEYA